MYKPSEDYAFPNKWMAEDFDKFQTVWEKCEKKRQEESKDEVLQADKQARP